MTTPWHQDTSYLRMMGSQLVAVWVSLDPLPAEHSLELVRGSHLGTLFNGSAFAAHDDTAPLYKQSKLLRRRTLSLRFLGPDVVFDGRPRDEVGAQEGNDAALAGVYGSLEHGTPFSTVLGDPL